MANEAGTDEADGVAVQVRAIVQDHGDLTTPIGAIADDDDLFAAGLTSLGVVRVLIAVEDSFGFEYPDEALSRDIFATIGSIAASVRLLAQSLPS